MQPGQGETEVLAPLEGDSDPEAEIVHGYDYSFGEDEELLVLDEDDLAEMLALGNPVEVIPESVQSEEDLEELGSSDEESDEDNDNDEAGYLEGEVDGLQSDTSLGYIGDGKEDETDPEEPES